tara:strand:- start:1239 stop:2123 length:885 start_codon:yes stop_codon:yes gene_type:complete
MAKIKPTIGIIGTGIIGIPMAKNLIKSKYKVFSYVRDIKKHKKIEKHGLKIIRNIEVFYNHVDILILAVGDTSDVKEILFGKTGLVKYLKIPKIVIDMSTICPIETIKMSKLLSNSKIKLIDAPVSGGEIGAIEGNLSIMVGGDKSIVEKIMPILKVLGNKITHIGKSGTGQVAKACNQIIVAQTINAVSEAFLIAEQFNADKKNIRQALLGGFAYSKILDIHGERILKNSYKPGFKTKLHAKDLRIAKNITNRKSLKLKGVNLVTNYMNKCEKEGFSEMDSSVYYKIIKKENK